MQFRVFSDLHLDMDHREGSLWVPHSFSSDINTTLIIAGDIWHGDKLLQTADWLNNLALRFKHIVVVLGNHDYWFSDFWKHQPVALKELVSNNVHILEKQFVDIEGIRIGGATLWTDFDIENPLRMINADNYTNDIKYTKGMTAKAWVDEYNDTVHWINSIKLDILVTHYVPSKKFCHSRYQGGAANCMFNSSTIEYIGEEKVPKIWVFGHTHDSYNEDYLGVKFICNPRGYGYENMHFDEVSKYEL